jgi:prophage regulatory protein
MHSLAIAMAMEWEGVMADADLDVAPEPKRVTRLIRLKEVQHRVGLGRSTIYRWMAEGKFPKPVQLGGYAVAWAEDDLEGWISSRLVGGIHDT